MSIKVPRRLTAKDRERIAHPYLPSSQKPNLFGRHQPLAPLTPPPGSAPKAEPKPEPEPDLGDIVDAETGERLMPTKSIWSTTEGRLNMDRHTIIIRGTGALDVSLHDPLRAAAFTQAHPQLQQQQHRRKMHGLVADFLRQGPLQPMHHKYWSPETGEVTLPPGYVNDEDGDAPPPGYDEDVAFLRDELRGASDDTASLHSSSLASSIGFGSISGGSVAGSGTGSGSGGGSKGRRETADERKARWRREKLERMQGKKAGLAKLVEDNAPKKEGDVAPPALAAPEPKELVVSDASTIASQVSDKLDPGDPAVWKALEARYFSEICAYAVEYEANKQWTKERRMPNGVRGMQEACRQYAQWRALAVKNLVSAIDEEQRRDVQRIEIEDQITDEAKLRAQVLKHDEERHAHRTFVRASLYETEIVMVNRLYKMGILW